MPFLKHRVSGGFLIGCICMLISRQAAALPLCNLLCSCTISTSSVGLSGYNPISNQPITATGTVTVSCQLLSTLLGTVTDPYTITLSSGLSSGFSSRQMSGPTSTRLNYNLYSDALMSTVWGDGTGISQLVSNALTLSVLNLNVPQIQTIYAQIPGGQNVPLGTYSDTITATLQF